MKRLKVLITPNVLNWATGKQAYYLQERITQHDIDVISVKEINSWKKITDILGQYECHHDLTLAVSFNASDAFFVPRVITVPHVTDWDRFQFGTNADLLHFYTEKCEQEAIRRYPWIKNKAVTFPIVLLDKDKFCPAYNKREQRRKMSIPENAFILGWFASEDNNDGNRKRPDFLIDLLTILKSKKTKTDFFLLLGGPGWEGLERTLEERSIPFIHFNPSSFDDMPKLYQLLDAYLITSSTEGNPMTLFESSACGVPVISTAVGRVPYVIKHGENGFILDFNMNEWIRCLEHMCDNRILTEKMGVAARKKIEHLDLPQVEDTFSKLYVKAYNNWLKRVSAIHPLAATFYGKKIFQARYIANHQGRLSSAPYILRSIIKRPFTGWGWKCLQNILIH